MSMMFCDVCGELRDSDWIEFFATQKGDTCIYCMEDDESLQEIE